MKFFIDLMQQAYDLALADNEVTIENLASEVIELRKQLAELTNPFL